MNKRGLKPTIFLTKNRRGQVWVESVIYTLIAFVMIGLVLAFAKPKIEELQDKAILEQSLNMMKEIDNTILTMGGAGNQRLLEMNIKKGALKIDGENNKVVFEMNSKYLYSEEGKTIPDGNILINTKKSGGNNFVNLTREYTNTYNITYAGEDKIKTISQSATAYKILITNRGGTPPVIDFSIS